MGDPAEVWYGIILGRDLIATQGLDINLYWHAIVVVFVTYEGWSISMFDVNHYYFKLLMNKNIKPDELFTNTFINKCFKSEHIRIS